nr:RNA-directed DNA polymerase, eukaryota [Tanacetum cinerariifolium]
MELEERNEDFFARKRLCIKTKQLNNILESFKIIVKGKVFWVRAKELFVWSSSFLEDMSDIKAVSETYFGVNGKDQEKFIEVEQSPNEKEGSEDPFNIYELLNKQNKEVGNSGMESSIPYPPGFTPDNNKLDHDVQEAQAEEVTRPHIRSDNCSSRIFEEVEKSDNFVSTDGRDNRNIRKEGGSILDVLDEMIRVGSNAKKDWIQELTNKHKVSFLTLQETKKESNSAMEVKYLWGNYAFDHIVSEALGNSGGILCAWDSNVFHKKHHIISDNFVVLYGTWVPKKMHMLIISIYAPQYYASKHKLWSFTASLINRWNRESVQWFFKHGYFASGCNSSFVTLIPKTADPKMVSEFRPIRLIGSLYKVVTKILATRLANVISDLISNVQTTFLPNRQILDGPFIVNEILARCKYKNQHAMIFKVDFAKAYDSIRWDYLDDVLNAFGFGHKWRSWIQ